MRKNAPKTNLAESVYFTAFGVAAFGLIASLIALGMTKEKIWAVPVWCLSLVLAALGFVGVVLAARHPRSASLPLIVCCILLRAYPRTPAVLKATMANRRCRKPM